MSSAKVPRTSKVKDKSRNSNISKGVSMGEEPNFLLRTDLPIYKKLLLQRNSKRTNLSGQNFISNFDS